jgi:hexokinase
MPGTEREIGAEEFFDALASRLAPVIHESSRIGFCFSYPADILPNRDARIRAFNKEVKITGAEGLLVGETLREALRSRGLPPDKRITVLNDAVAVQLGAAAGGSGERGVFTGLVMGTGINASYTEKNGNIEKDVYLKSREGSTVINIESGAYKGLPLEEPDRRFIAATADPGRQWLEKMAAGAYQPGLLLEWIRFAGAKGLFSDGFCRRLESAGPIGPGEGERFYLSPDGEGVLPAVCGGEEDGNRLRLLIEAFFDRVSFITAGMLTAVLARARRAAGPAAGPAVISAEGSTFYKSHMLRPRIGFYMENCARKTMGLDYRFVKVENATLAGAALAGLADG